LWGGAAESDTGVILLVIVATWFASLWQHARGQRTQGVFNDAATTTAITLYVGGCLGFLLLLRHDVSAWWIAAVVLITKSCDIGAYFTGCSIGRHKLIPWVSPGKTVEGLIGGLAMAAGIAVLASFVLANYGYAEISWPRAIVLGVLLGLAGQAGDLSMSLLKRDAEVKDCSDTIPGMGGIMDVLDSLLLAAPVAWLYLR
jgi:phosphatidate cytidylyltransferase